METPSKGAFDFYDSVFYKYVAPTVLEFPEPTAIAEVTRSRQLLLSRFVTVTWGMPAPLKGLAVRE